MIQKEEYGKGETIIINHAMLECETEKKITTNFFIYFSFRFAFLLFRFLA